MKDLEIQSAICLLLQVEKGQMYGKYDVKQIFEMNMF